MKIAVLLSGGVDSSTALWRLKESGYTDIEAYYLKIWLEDDSAYLGDCPWEEDLSFAERVCKAAGVRLNVVSLQLEYYEKVVSYAIEELKAGRTPSPDIFCNQRIKFGAFFDHVASGFDKVASGHYARLSEDRDGFHLLRAPDPVKDQTYFLSHLGQHQLSRILFPIGDLNKSEVRQMAARYDLANKDRPDSQGICFLGKIKYNDFVRHYLGEKPGKIVDIDNGEVLGTHRGFWFHTVGQRAGLGLGNGPWYVAAKDSDENVIYVRHGSNAEAAERRVFEVGELSWISGRAPGVDDLMEWNGNSDADGALSLKLRHGPQLIPCRLEARGERLSVTMSQGDRGIAAGQFAVFYRGDDCVGSGKIREAARVEAMAVGA